MAIIFDEQGNLVDTENRVQFGNENFDSEPYEYTPNYLGANSPMLNDEGNATLSSVTNYGYDPAFGQLQNHFYGDTRYPGSGSRTGYFDDYLQTQQVPSLQRALGNPRFALAPELTSQPQELGYVEPAAVPKEAIYQDRIMNNNLPSYGYEPSTRFRDASNMAEYLQGNPQIMDNIQNTIGSGIDKFKSGLGSIKDFAIDKGRMGKNLLGSAGAMALGLPGIVGSGAMALMGGLGNAFEDRQLSGDGTTVDEYGRSYNASDLNKMNARGGYYTEAARSSRRRTNRINDMLSRKAKGKRISAANLARLQAQEAAQEQARLAATRQMAEQNRQSGSGGYQAGYGGGFMGGSGTAADMGSFRDGGLASMFTRRR